MKKLILLLLLFFYNFSISQNIDKDTQMILNEYANITPIDYGSLLLERVYVKNSNFYYKYSVKNCETLKRNIKNITFLETMTNAYLTLVNDDEYEAKWELETIGKNHVYFFTKYSCEDGSNSFEVRYRLNNGRFILDSNLGDLVKL